MAALLNILYHGNCIDGWFSAFVIYTALKDKYEDVHFLPISPNQPRTWPALKDITGRDIILTDVMVSKEILADWEGVANSVFCIDHHETTKDAMSEMPNALHNMECCATKIAWQHYNPDKDIPQWVEQINRIDLWQDITEDDRALREVLNPMAHQEENFLLKTEEFVENFTDEAYRTRVLAVGKEELAKKDESLQLILNKSRSVYFNEEKCDKWGLDKEHWLNKRGILIDTSGIILDSTEAGYLALRDNPSADFFCNFRRKEFLDKETRKQKIAYVYSVRARPGMDVTADGVFKGHKTSAGANIVKGSQPLPFV